MAGVALLALAAGAAHAQEAAIDIRAQPLAQALKAIAQQTGRNILFTADAVDGIQARELNGRMSARDAVTALLQGTPLEVLQDDNGGLIVRRAPTQRAQTSPASDDTGGGTIFETVEVSASRIAIAGYQQPTPVMVLNQDRLDQDAYLDIGDAIRALPSVGASISPNNGASSGIISGAAAGTDTINLRNLGTLRTLVLFDGQRVTQSNITGGVDLSTIPTSLVQRIDVVTGGASASWGSDAVAGVVNLILNKDFTGFKADVEGGDTFKNDRRSFKIEASWGGGFAGGRGHLVLSGQHTDSPDAVFLGQRGWYKDTYLVNNPAYAGVAGVPRLIHASNVGLSQATPGGVITASPAGPGGAADALRGIQFAGPLGTPTPFNFGNISGALASGGDANVNTGETLINLLATPYRTTTLFGYASYRLSAATKVSLQLNYGKSWAENDAQTASQLGNLTIRNDNAYLDPAIAARMAALGITSFTMGTTNSNNLNLNAVSLTAAARSLGVPVNVSNRQLMRGVVTLDGTLGPDWSWNAYYQHGIVRVGLRVLANTLNQNYRNAVDAVTVTAANRGDSGLPIGGIACRSTLVDPGNGCQPLDVFGTGVASAAAIAYVSPGTDYENIILNEDVAAASIEGEPARLPAGPVAVAFGTEYRKEGGRTIADPRGANASWFSANFTDFAGQYHVEEAFFEVNAPLLKGAAGGALDFNGAGRLTRYSTSGMVETWKLGLTARVNDDIRLRTSWSVDIRAPNLSELFTSSQINTVQALDPHSGQVVTAFTNRQGNPGLKPEKAITASGGVVLTPRGLAGFSASLDWYSIDIKQAIYTTSAAQVLALCNTGMTVFCSQLVYGGGAYPGVLSQIDIRPFNASAQTVSGLDFQADYAMAWLSGTLDWRLLGNYTDEETQTAFGTVFDSAGSLGADSAVTGVPKFRATLSATYRRPLWSVTVQGRFTGTARLNTAWTSGVDVDDNAVPAVAYLDLRASYRWSDDILLYGAVDNANNVPPPSVAPSSNSTNPYQSLDTRSDIYDALGRTFRIGVRLAY